MYFPKPKRSVILIVSAVLFSALALGGCRAGAPSGPPSIRYGKDLCAECRMIISEERFAAGAADEAGEVVKFDSVGCLIRFLRDKPGQTRVWVKRYDSDGWIDVRNAFFVLSEKILAPMGYGVAATDSKTDAEKIAGELEGKIMDFSELMTRLQKHP
jgi:copper chaperone NosL